MYLRVVVLICLHKMCVGSLNELNSDRYQSNSCFRICCDLITQDLSCKKLNISEVIEWHGKSNFPDTNIKFGRPCDNVIPVNASESFIKNGEINSKFHDDKINLCNYCLQFTSDKNDTRHDIGAHLYICVEQSNGDFEKSLVRIIGTSVALPLLIITLFVLWHVQQLKSNQGKCLMCYILSLILLYIFLILDRMDIVIMKIPWLCEISGYMMYISILCCIFWLNVMCYDIWKTFKNTRNPQYPSDSQKFWKYLFYGFGLPIILTTILAVIDETSLFPENWRPQIGKYECFLRNARQIEFFYLYLPMSFVLIVNVILCLITAYKIYTVQNGYDGKIERRRSVPSNLMRNDYSREIERRRPVSCSPIRIRFLLYLRLFLLMGITWSMEGFSWIFDANSTSFFIVSDIVNAVHGFVIFVLFVCRTNVMESVLTKNRSEQGLNNIFGSSTKLDRARNSLVNDESIVKFLKNERYRNG